MAAATAASEAPRCLVGVAWRTPAAEGSRLAAARWLEAAIVVRLRSAIRLGRIGVREAGASGIRLRRGIAVSRVAVSGVWICRGPGVAIPVARVAIGLVSVVLGPVGIARIRVHLWTIRVGLIRVGLGTIAVVLLRLAVIHLLPGHCGARVAIAW